MESKNHRMLPQALSNDSENTHLFRGMPGVWKSRHHLILGWLVFMQVLYPGRKTLKELARWPLGSITVWRFCRVLKASY